MVASIDALDKVPMTYYDHWENGKPAKAEGNGSFVTDSVHAAFHYALLIQTAVDLCIECYTVFLILRVGTKKLRVFRQYLLLCMIGDICLSAWVGLFWHPRALFPLWACLTSGGLASLLGHRGAVYGQTVANFFSATIVLSQLYALLYRLVVVVGAKATRRFVSKPTTVLCISLILALSLGLAHIKNRVFTEASEKDVQLMQLTEFITSEDTSVACWDFSSVSNLLNSSLIVIGSVIGAQIAAVVIIVFIFRRLKSTNLLSAHTKAMYARLTKLLLIQSFVPSIFILTPIAARSVIAIYPVAVYPVFAYAALFLLMLFPLTNALLTIHFVRPYRDFTKAMLQKATCRDFSKNTEKIVYFTAQNDAFSRA